MTHYRHNVVRRTVRARQSAAAEAQLAEWDASFRQLKREDRLRNIKFWSIGMALAISSGPILKLLLGL
jgi:hypothetical protein